MTLYMVGGISANLKPLWQRLWNAGGHDVIIALAGCFSRPWVIEDYYAALGILEKRKQERDGGKMTLCFAGRPHMGVRDKIADIIKDEKAKGDGEAEQNMDLHLAGTTDGNMGRFIDKNLKALEAGKEKGEDMELYLAGGHNERDTRVPRDKQHGVHILESFYYADEFTEKMIPYFGKFLLDSGAFTLFSDKSKGKGIIWEEYVDKYADFIVRNKVERFFELDIDKLVGGEKVLELRRRLENKAGRPCIPVWHKFRGKDNFLRMCEEYRYVAIGGIVSKEIKPDEYKYFPWFIRKAHEAGAKIHGLGFTALQGLPKYHFDSVDSTAWTTGNRFGAVYRFNGTTMVKINKGEGQRLKDSRAVAVNNFNEWVKFQRYAETHF